MEKKRILILTHRLGHNFGGIMQAYALQVYLRQYGVEPFSTHISYARSGPSLYRSARYLLKRILHNIKPSISNLPLDYGSLVNHNTRKFVDTYIKEIPGKQAISGDITQRYDALIAGSDQVWRSLYVPVSKYLFDFVDGQKITRLSYAASFGKDDLDEYSPELLSYSKRLAQQFDAISVREDSGIDLVKKHWEMEAECHVDPTMLLDKDHYIELVSHDAKRLPKSQGNLFAYVLDRGDGKGEIIDKVADTLHLQDFEILPPIAQTLGEYKSNPEKFQLPPVTGWLQSFIDAEFVITDSFHGTVFAIIFNKPFLAIGNRERGLARFSSLLKLFELEDRLVSEVSQVSNELIKQHIDWSRINSKIEQEKRRSNNFLTKGLGLGN